jgi:hypothetical protein
MVAFRTNGGPGHHAASGLGSVPGDSVSQPSNPISLQKRPLLSGFPLFVPSLSWQNDRFCFNHLRRGGGKTVVLVAYPL